MSDSGLQSPLLHCFSSNDDSDCGNDNAHDPLLRPLDDERVPTMEDDGGGTTSHASRILDRDGAFHQSRGHWGVQRVHSGARCEPGSRNRLRRFWEDWFHSLAYKPTFQLMAIIFISYCGAVFFFAGVYLSIAMLGNRSNSNPNDGGSFCRMDIFNHMDALYFSLSTMTTIGYGVSDYYFGDCWTPLLLVLWQSCTAIAFQSVAIGLLFQRISRGQKRGKTIIFSDKAVVQRVRGVPHFMFRVAEMRRYHLIEAHVRCYCLRHERFPNAENPCHVESTLFLTRHVKLLHPDESIGRHILMSVPQVIVHRMDETSPLVPSESIWYDANSSPHVNVTMNHEDRSIHSLKHFTNRNDSMDSFLRDRQAEIIVLVEGTDELTGATVQARHSYLADDICWDHTFGNCIQPFMDHDRHRGRSMGDPVCSVDYARFHEVVPISPDSQTCPYIPR